MECRKPIRLARDVEVLSTFFRVSLIWVSMTWLNGGKMIAITGVVGGRSLDVRRYLIAVTGHR